MEAIHNTAGPLNQLRLMVEGKITVELRDGETFEGVLKAFDEHMNLLLLNVKGRDILFLRGDTVLTIRQESL